MGRQPHYSQRGTLGNEAVIVSQLITVFKILLILNRLNSLAVKSTAKIENNDFLCASLLLRYRYLNNQICNKKLEHRGKLIINFFVN